MSWLDFKTDDLKLIFIDILKDEFKMDHIVDPSTVIVVREPYESRIELRWLEPFATVPSVSVWCEDSSVELTEQEVEQLEAFNLKRSESDD